MLVEGEGYSALRAPLAPGRYPLLVFAPGARLTAYDYRALLEDVASRGYVIVALTPAEGADYAAVTGLIRACVNVAIGWSIDAEDALGVGIDTRRVGVFGHSLGGAAAAWAASQDARVGAVLNFDGDYTGGAEAARPRQPLLQTQCFDPGEPAPSRARRARVWSQVCAASAGACLLDLSGMRHFNFLDAALLAARMPQERAHGRFGTIDSTRGLRLAGALACGFFQEHLNGDAGALTRTLRAFPEATEG